MFAFNFDLQKFAGDSNPPGDPPSGTSSLGGGGSTPPDTLQTITNSSRSPVILGSTIRTVDASSRTTALKLTANALANTIRGGSGVDTIYGGACSDSIFGNSGNYKLYGEAGISSTQELDTILKSSNNMIALHPVRNDDDEFYRKFAAKATSFNYENEAAPRFIGTKNDNVL